MMKTREQILADLFKGINDDVEAMVARKLSLSTTQVFGDRKRTEQELRTYWSQVLMVERMQALAIENARLLENVNSPAANRQSTDGKALGDLPKFERTQLLRALHGALSRLGWDRESFKDMVNIGSMLQLPVSKAKAMIHVAFD